MDFSVPLLWKCSVSSHPHSAVKITPTILLRECRPLLQDKKAKLLSVSIQSIRLGVKTCGFKCVYLPSSCSQSWWPGERPWEHLCSRTPPQMPFQHTVFIGRCSAHTDTNTHRHQHTYTPTQTYTHNNSDTAKHMKQEEYNCLFHPPTPPQNTRNYSV